MSSAAVLTCMPDSGRIFRETSMRPPVPGQETKTYKSEKPPMDSHHFEQHLRHKDDFIREAEGCVAHDSRFSRWGRSLNLLLDDQDGATLFRMYLEGEGLVDLLSFWFACNGFRAMDPSEPKTSKTAKAIYRWYVQNSQAVSCRLKPSTRVQVKECVKNQQLNKTVFDQAQQEIQRAMEQEAFTSFLQSDICKEYARGVEDSPTPESPGSGLPTLTEDEEFGGLHHLSSGFGKVNRAFTRIPPRNQRYHLRKPEHTYQYFAPAASINDSEISSDALTEDSMSMTDGSVDGIPPYRTKKQREIHRSVSANGQVHLPFVPRTMRPPAEMLPANPAEFAAKLTVALEKVKKQREAEEKLEERLQRLKEEEEKAEYDIPSSNHDTVPGTAALEDDPQSILDDHVSRVLKTPANLSPRSQSPFIQRKGKFQPAFSKGQNSSSCQLRPKALQGMEATVTSSSEHRSCISTQGPKSSRKTDACPSAHRPEEGASSSVVLTTPLTAEQEVERNHSVLQWVLDSAKLMKKHHRDTSTSVSHCPEVKKTTHRASSQPAHLFLQDTSMPPLTAPNTLDQLEEARRRLVEDKRVPKLHKSRCVQSSTLKEKGKAVESAPSSGFSTLKFSEEHKTAKKQSADCPGQGLAIVYYFCGERIPYMIRTKEPSLTLQEFKELLSKKGSYKYYFKKESQEFECNAVFQEVSEEDAVLPLFDEKIICKVERAC